MDLVVVSARIERTLDRPPFIRLNGKRALDEGWPTGPFDDPDQWRARLAHHHGNVGLVMGRGMAGLDPDLYKPGAEDSWKALVADTGLDEDTVRGVTGRGGLHVLYRYPPELHMPSMSLAPFGYPSIELKGDGGYLCVEPSISIESGREYRWEHGGWAPGERDVAFFSDAFLALIAGTGPSTFRGRWQHVDALDELELDPRTVDVARLLIEHFGAHSPAVVGGGELALWRPGKDNESASVTIGYIAPGVGKIWTDSWPPFTQGQVVDARQLRDLAGITPVIDIPTIELPPGYRLWQSGDDLRPKPVLASVGRHGPVGRFLTLLEGQSEAGPPAVGAIVLAHLGTIIGRQAVVTIGPYRHHANLFELIIGETSTGGKGTADDTAELLIGRVDPSFFVRHVLGGFGSGEALVDTIADTEEGAPNEKRRVVHEAEFSTVLRVSRRESSILSQIIRQGFDYKPIQHRTKSSGTVISTGHHLAVVGAITPAELMACSSQLDIENGWLNRFMFIHAEIVDTLPFGGTIDDRALDVIARHLRDALGAVEERALLGNPVTHRISADTLVGERWQSWYRIMRFGTGQGRLRALTRRQHVQAARLALIFAVLDQADELTADHLDAAIAWTDYSVATVDRYFGTGPGGPAGKLLDAIRRSAPNGLSVSEQHDVFDRHLSASELDHHRGVLENDHLIFTYSLSTGGRPKALSVAITRDES